MGISSYPFAGDRPSLLGFLTLTVSTFLDSLPNPGRKHLKQLSQESYRSIPTRFGCPGSNAQGQGEDGRLTLRRRPLAGQSRGETRRRHHNTDRAHRSHCGCDKTHTSF